MADPVLQDVAQDIARINIEIDRGRDLLAALEEAGEDVSRLRGELNTNVVRRDKWVRMLKARGITVPGE